MTDLHKSYYAIIPANVRYDNDLPANAKLLYGEITALCNERGYCWATNNYFSELYSVSDRAIRNWISKLSDKGYITLELNKNKEGTLRKMRLTSYGAEKNFLRVGKKLPEGAEEIFHHNTTENNKNNNTSNIKGKAKPFIPPSLEDVKNYVSEKGYNVDANYFYEYFEAGDWTDGKGNKVKNWKQKLVTWAKHNDKRTALNDIKKQQDDMFAELLAECEMEGKEND